MLRAPLLQLETDFFRALNQVAEPLIRAGFGNPLFWPTGTIVLETSGRKSGRKFNVPVLATRIGDLFVLSTVRRNSQWLKNLLATPEVRYWMGGKAVAATAFVFRPEQSVKPDRLPAQAVCLAELLQRQSRLLGISFAILTPRR